MLTFIPTGTLMQYSELELLTMHQRLSQELITTEPNTKARRIILATLENIIRVINFKRCQKPKPPGF